MKNEPIKGYFNENVLVDKNEKSLWFIEKILKEGRVKGKLQYFVRWEGDTTLLSLIKTGHVRLDVQFKKALTETVSCIVYSESMGLFQINKERDIIAE